MTSLGNQSLPPTNLGQVDEEIVTPARSPNVSPIEHVWDMAGCQIRASQNIADLEQKPVNAWKNASQDVIKNLYHSLQRVETVDYSSTSRSEEPEMAIDQGTCNYESLPSDETFDRVPHKRKLLAIPT
ncbi:hypothetical protein TNCV_2727701 [Trichonephila clavipes]|nr:hypothetical protein TNCV_2727701 [Trichonephila clavipes]